MKKTNKWTDFVGKGCVAEGAIDCDHVCAVDDHAVQAIRNREEGLQRFRVAEIAQAALNILCNVFDELIFGRTRARIFFSFSGSCAQRLLPRKPAAPATR